MVDNRARLCVKGSGYTIPFNGPASPLRANNGIIFPYTPIITSGLTSEYAQYNLVHTNYPMQSFIRHRPSNISLQAKFINQTVGEAKYTVGVMHFLSVVMKMHFGNEDVNAGTPPPLLVFSAYGSVNFEKVPVFVSNYSTTYPDDVDYITFTNEAIAEGPLGPISSNMSPTSLPVVMNMTIELTPHYPAVEQTSFDLKTFSEGNLYSRGFI